MKPVTSSQMKRIDRTLAERYKIPVLVLMDNAGRSVAEAAAGLLDRRGWKKAIVVIGGGHNGGDGVAAARYLQGWGYRVHVFWLADPARWEGDPALHYQMAKRCGVRFTSFRRIPPRKRVRALTRGDLLIDALLGTGTRGHLRVPTFDAIAAMNAARKPIIAVDLPSGLDPDTGRVLDIAIRARITVTLAAPKRGLLFPRSRRYVGRLVVADIGIPRSLLKS